MEGVCQQLALVRDAFSATDVPVGEVRATGGAVASSLWVRTLAAALDLLRAELRPGDVVLVKASRSYGLELLAADLLPGGTGA